MEVKAYLLYILNAVTPLIEYEMVRIIDFPLTLSILFT